MRISSLPCLMSVVLILTLMPVTAALAGDVDVISDPTRPSGFSAPTGEAGKVSEQLRLESVLIASNRRVAVINGKTCRVGDRLEGAQLMAINADGAVLLREGKRIALPLLKVKVRKYGQ